MSSPPKSRPDLGCTACLFGSGVGSDRDGDEVGFGETSDGGVHTYSSPMRKEQPPAHGGKIGCRGDEDGRQEAVDDCRCV